MENCERLRREFDRQVENLLQNGYPAAAGLSAEDFLRHVEPLADKVEALAAPAEDLPAGRLPFVIVIASSLVATDTAMRLAMREGRAGITRLHPHQPQDFLPIEDVHIPQGAAYLLEDIDRGRQSLNLAPRDALPLMKEAGRSPLTIDEGVAIITHYPAFLRKNNCFSLLASRSHADKCVPAIWINAQKKANLGWCWEGNPHTWLGSASCKRRIGA